MAGVRYQELKDSIEEMLTEIVASEIVVSNAEKPLRLEAQVDLQMTDYRTKFVFLLLYRRKENVKEITDQGWLYYVNAGEFASFLEVFLERKRRVRVAAYHWLILCEPFKGIFP